MSKFRTRQGVIIDDLKKYVENWLSDKPEVSVYVGCDSQAHGKTINYAVSVCMYEKGKGGHIITKRTTEAKTNSKTGKWDRADNSKRLWVEVEKATDVADELKSLNIPITIHVDYNSNPDELSNELYSAGLGWAIAKGYNAAGKPDAWAASKAADKGAR